MNWGTFLSEPWVQHMGWVLVHFLWQGTGVALLLAVALRLLARSTSHVRYIVIGLALLTCGMLPATTWMALDSRAATPASALPPIAVANLTQVETPSAAIPVANLVSPIKSQTTWPARLSRMANLALPFVVSLWFTGVVVLTLRLTLGWAMMQRLCRSGIPVHELRCRERFESLLARMQISGPVRLLESGLVEVPTLIGWLRPTILLPASVFVGLSPDQLDAILAHELAHVRRYDYLVNLFQTVIETILFYHPAVWWISRKLREERENCCDDIALEVAQDRLVYASALAQLEEGRALPLAMTATGGSLVQRIRRIARQGAPAPAPSWPVSAAMLSLLLATSALPLVNAEVSSSKTPAATPSAVGPIHDLYLQMRLKNFQVKDVPLDKLVAKIEQVAREQDPAQKGFPITLHLPPGETPLKITYGPSSYTGDLPNLLYYLADRFPIEYEIRDTSREYDTRQAPVTITQLPASEVRLNQKMAQTKIDLDLHDADITSALKTLGAQAAAKGFPLQLDTDLIATRPAPPITLKAHGWSVQHALLSLCYLADLIPVQLDSCAGYTFRSGTDAERHDRTGIRLCVDTAFTKDGAPLPSASNRTNEPTLIMPAYPANEEAGKVEPQTGTISKPFAFRHQPGAPEGDVTLVENAPSLETNFQSFVVDKTHVHLVLTLRLWKQNGTVLRQFTGEATTASGAMLNLVFFGKPLQLETPDEPATKSNLSIFVRAD